MDVMRTAVVAAILAVAAPAAFAQTYPAKPVRIIIPFPTGGGAEQATRIVANHLTKALGQPFVIESRPGGNTIIGAETVAKSAPDGYTLFVCGPSTMTSNPVLYAGKLPYDPQRDFVPVGMVSKTPYFLVVSSALPAKSLPELLALARAKPGELSYASNGNATTNHLGYEILARAGGATLTHVPYKGFGQAMPTSCRGASARSWPISSSSRRRSRPGSSASSPSPRPSARRSRPMRRRSRSRRARLRNRRLVRDVRADGHAARRRGEARRGDAAVPATPRRATPIGSSATRPPARRRKHCWR